MLQNAPTCPECLTRSSRWLPSSSDIGMVDYFRCDRCGTVWVVGETPGDVRFVTVSNARRKHTMLMFLFVDLEAGLLFARMAQGTYAPDRRWTLKCKSQKVHDSVTKFLPSVDLSDEEHDRVCLGLRSLKDEIEKIPA